MSHTEINQMTLSNSLSRFGLNPNDWRIYQVMKREYVIEHLQDPSIKIKGIVECDPRSPLPFATRWKSLQIIAL
jgi:hypothetical protein